MNVAFLFFLSALAALGGKIFAKLCSNNVAGNSVAKYNREEWQQLFGHDKGSLFADPRIHGLDEFDFTLASDSPAYALGFSALPDAVAKPRKN